MNIVRALQNKKEKKAPTSFIKFTHEVHAFYSLRSYFYHYTQHIIPGAHY